MKLTNHLTPKILEVDEGFHTSLYICENKA